MAHFSLNFLRDDDGEVSLIATMDTGEFKGRCHYWCPPDEFDDLATALQTFPIPKERPLDLCLYDGCIELRIEPIDAVGHLDISVALQDYNNDRNRCQSGFQTSYGEVDRFREQLDHVRRAGTGEAVLSAQ